MNPRFYYATSQVGAEKAVKSEILSEFPALRFAFTRPGFITFKEENDSKPAIRDTSSIFARIWGVSVGQAKDEAALIALLKDLPKDALVHAFERDVTIPGDERDEFVPNARIDSLVARLKESNSEFKSLRWNAKPKLNDTVYDLIWLDDFHVFLGKHIHTQFLDDARGNQPLIELSKDSPSRAYLKIEEAIHRFRPEIVKDSQVLEVGCSPGGATTAMLNRGLRVIGVDPKRMDAKLYERPTFSFIQKLTGDLTPQDLRTVNPSWIVMDMNIAPLEAIDELGHAIQCLKQNFGPALKLRQGFLTIKLNDWKFAESIPLYLKRLSEIGFHHQVAMQLCSNRQEFFVYAQFGR